MMFSLLEWWWRNVKLKDTEKHKGKQEMKPIYTSAKINGPWYFIHI